MAAQSLGLDILGFHPNQIGLHSARSGKQVLEFSLGRSLRCSKIKNSLLSFLHLQTNLGSKVIPSILLRKTLMAFLSGMLSDH